MTSPILETGVNGTTVTHVDIGLDYDHAWLLRFLRPRAVPGVETFDGDTYTRALRIRDGLHILRLAPTESGVNAHIRPPLRQGALLQIARAMVGADNDLAAFRAHVRNDPILGPLVAARARH